MATYYVATNGKDNNSGSISEPWATGNHRLSPGDTVYYRAGTYAHQLAPLSSGTASKPLTYAAYHGENARLIGDPNSNTIIEINGCKNVTIDGFEIKKSSISSDRGVKKWAWIQIGDNAENITIQNLNVHKDVDPLSDYRQGYREMGVQISDSDRVTIESCRISGMNKGIALRGACTNTWIKRNHISGTAQSCIVLGPSESVLRGCLIEQNLLENSAIEDGIQFLPDYNSADITQDVSNRGTIIRNNVVRNNNENAIDLKGARFVCIEENVIYGSVGSSNGPLNGWNRNALYGIARGNQTECRDIIIRHNIMYDNPRAIKLHGENTKIYNNTIIYNNRDHTGGDSTYGSDGSFGFVGIFQQFSTQVNLGIRNNLIGGHKTGQIALRLGSTSVDIDYNFYFQGRDGAPFNVDYRAPNNFNTYQFSAWQSKLAADNRILGNDSHSQWVSWEDIAFVDVPEKPTQVHTSYNFELQNRSVAFMAGGALTSVRSGGSSNRIPVNDASWFMDGYNSALINGDIITVDTESAVIQTIDLNANVLIVDRVITFKAGAPVYFGTSNQPHVGADKNSGDVVVPPTPTPSRVPKLLWIGNPIGLREGTSD